MTNTTTFQEDLETSTIEFAKAFYELIKHMADRDYKLTVFNPQTVEDHEDRIRVDMDKYTNRYKLAVNMADHMLAYDDYFEFTFEHETGEQVVCFCVPDNRDYGSLISDFSCSQEFYEIADTDIGHFFDKFGDLTI